jgi:hypothetical protein
LVGQYYLSRYYKQFYEMCNYSSDAASILVDDNFLFDVIYSKGKYRKMHASRDQSGFMHACFSYTLGFPIHRDSLYTIHQDSLYIRILYTPELSIHRDSLYTRILYTPGFPIHRDSLYTRILYTPGFPIHQDSLYTRIPYTPGFCIHPRVYPLIVRSYRHQHLVLQEDAFE